jgi:DNA repair protein RadA/Sms
VFPAPVPISLADVDPGAQIRIDTGMGEFNRVLGGGLVAGSVVLLGGEPGVGKSTLLLQALLRMTAAGISTLLVSGEESAAQVKLRSNRLAGDSSGLPLLSETQTEAVVACLEQTRPAGVCVDSVQTLWSSELGSTPGSVAQIRDAAGKLLRTAKTHDIALILVGLSPRRGNWPVLACWSTWLTRFCLSKANTPDPSASCGCEESLRFDQRGGGVSDGRPRPGGGG